MVRRRAYAAGSKSAREAVMLETDQGTYRLQRRGGNPFHDPELEKLVGQQVICAGTLSRDTVLVDSWKILDR